MEYAWKLKGFQLLEEMRRESSMLNAYYSGYGVIARQKGSKAMKLDKFLMQFASDERKERIHKSKIDKIKRITELNKNGI